jgi:hypothetical protein
LTREFEALDDFFRQAEIRQAGASAKMPKTSRLLDEFAAANGLDLKQKEAREGFYKALGDIKKRAPVIHISFAADPSANFTAKIVDWLRKNIQPQLLITIGLEPSLAAGCIVRTTNKQFDFSLREHLKDKCGLLVEKLQLQTAGASQNEQ